MGYFSNCTNHVPIYVCIYIMVLLYVYFSGLWISVHTFISHKGLNLLQNNLTSILLVVARCIDVVLCIYIHS